MDDNMPLFISQNKDLFGDIWTCKLVAPDICQLFCTKVFGVYVTPMDYRGDVLPHKIFAYPRPRRNLFQFGMGSGYSLVEYEVARYQKKCASSPEERALLKKQVRKALKDSLRFFPTYFMPGHSPP